MASVKRMLGSPQFLAWSLVLGRSVLVAGLVILIALPFGYSITNDHGYVLTGMACGLSVGIGICLQLGSESGLARGAVCGIVVGMSVPILYHMIPGFDGPAVIAAPIIALTVGLADGLGSSRLCGYREAGRLTLLAGLLTSFGFLAAEMIQYGLFAEKDDVNWAVVIVPLFFAPLVALVAGFVNNNLEGQRFSRPPTVLWLATLASLLMFAAISVFERVNYGLEDPNVAGVLEVAGWSLLLYSLVPSAILVAARGLSIWLRPRLKYFSHIVAYLRVMWVPLGGFILGYLVIILVFSGFCGMLERFVPGSFDGASDASIGNWISFSFFSEIGRDYSGITPVSIMARALVGGRLLLSIGWVLIIFSAMMAAVRPQLEHIGRRDMDTELTGDTSEQET